jgi:hypothetical protein
VIVVWLQADVRALQRQDDMLDKRVEKVESDVLANKNAMALRSVGRR